ncbi:hypothetical protein [Cellulomonas septica]|uniref:Lipoprotein n=1 Tax=Cellulomonas septica TaxID=285080 RepID=A0ABX1JZX4_9CELL|nr:hypothetical protein [Cellulomonas septica]NKY39469.1 hypothetical protein [Cellulomonas septica]
MSRWVVVVVSTLVVGLLAGCGGAEEPAGLTAAPTTTPTPSATPTPEPEVDDLSDPELGIVFTDVPALTGDEADVHNWLATYEKEYWRTLRTNTVSPAFALIASPELQGAMQKVVDKNVAIQASIGGVLETRVGNVAVTGDQATGEICEDFSKATFADATRTYTPAEAGFGEKKHKAYTLTRVPGEDRWLVATNEVSGTC